MAATTLNISIPAETCRWLERFSSSRGNPGFAASRLIEEAKRHEQFRGVEFQDTSMGRIAYVQDSRVAVYFAWMTARDYGFDAEKIASHFAWPLCKAESALAYAEAFPQEIREQAAAHDNRDDAGVLRSILPALNISAPAV